MHARHATPLRPIRAGHCLLLALGLAACGEHAQAAPETFDGQANWGLPVVRFEPPPPFSEGQFPCSDCHEPDLPVKTARRELTKAHQEIRLLHGGERLWCWDCHDVKSRDELRAAGETLVAYDDAHVACGKCHSAELRDWTHGAHGVRTGSWSGERLAKRCAHCHDAHAPAFPPLEPMAAPQRPRRTR
jgi:hypothetical protein